MRLLSAATCSNRLDGEVRCVPEIEVLPCSCLLGAQPPLSGSVIKAAFDRHRGGGCPPTPATPPCVRVRTRRFELVALRAVDQTWKPERIEVRIGQPH